MGAAVVGRGFLDAYNRILDLYQSESDPVTKVRLLDMAKTLSDQAFYATVCGDSKALKGIFLAIPQLINPHLTAAERNEILTQLGQNLNEIVVAETKKDRAYAFAATSAVGAMTAVSGVVAVGRGFAVLSGASMAMLAIPGFGLIFAGAAALVVGIKEFL
ncbi:MAG: hypothetical protein LBC42_01440 [Puniceicoccales bacterium]|nr:hypothetical protein [Puniceicoccales bacterium]